MGAGQGVTRVVFDTNTVVSGLLFGGTVSWLIEHWRSRVSVPMVSRATADELLRVLHYPKFGLSPKDRMFLALAEAGRADVLVTGDDDLLVLRGQTRFPLETPEQYRARFV